MATKRDVITRAFRRIQVVGRDEAPEAHDYAAGLAALTELFAELNGPIGGCTLAFTINDAIPDGYAFPLAALLAARIAPEYSVQSPEAEINALMRVRSVNVPYVRDMDMDEDGETTEAEIDSFDGSRYY